MKTGKFAFRILTFALCIVLLGFSGCSSGTETSITEPATSADNTSGNVSTQAEETQAAPVTISKLTAAENMRQFVKFNGRTYYDNSQSAIMFNWSASGFEVKFTGTGLKAKLVSSLNSNSARYAYLYVYVDGADTPSGMVILNKTSATYTLASGLEAGEHTIKVVKRTCISYSTAGVVSMEALGDGAVFGEKPADKALLIEFIGDSITAGDGILTRDNTGSYCSDLQDVTKAYSYVLAGLLDADIRCVCRCGAGLVWDSGKKDSAAGGIPMTESYKYYDIYHTGGKTDYDFENERKPDVIVLNLGTNDCSSMYKDGALINDSLSERFMTEYANFLKYIREKNPDTPIVCTFGAMRNSKYDLKIDTVISNLTKEGITGISYVRVPGNDKTKYGQGLGGHPSDLKQADDAKLYLFPAVKTALGIN